MLTSNTSDDAIENKADLRSKSYPADVFRWKLMGD